MSHPCGCAWTREARECWEFSLLLSASRASLGLGDGAAVKRLLPLQKSQVRALFPHGGAQRLTTILPSIQPDSINGVWLQQQARGTLNTHASKTLFIHKINLYKKIVFHGTESSLFWLEQLASKLPGSACAGPTKLGLQACLSTARFSGGCWKFKLRSSCLHPWTCLLSSIFMI